MFEGIERSIIVLKYGSYLMLWEIFELVVISCNFVSNIYYMSIECVIQAGVVGPVEMRIFILDFVHMILLAFSLLPFTFMISE